MLISAGKVTVTPHVYLEDCADTAIHACIRALLTDSVNLGDIHYILNVFELISHLIKHVSFSTILDS